MSGGQGAGSKSVHSLNIPGLLGCTEPGGRGSHSLRPGRALAWHPLRSTSTLSRAPPMGAEQYNRDGPEGSVCRLPVVGPVGWSRGNWRCFAGGSRPTLNRWPMPRPAYSMRYCGVGPGFLWRAKLAGEGTPAVAATGLPAPVAASFASQGRASGARRIPQRLQRVGQRCRGRRNGAFRDLRARRKQGRSARNAVPGVRTQGHTTPNSP